MRKDNVFLAKRKMCKWPDCKKKGKRQNLEFFTILKGEKSYNSNTCDTCKEDLDIIYNNILIAMRLNSMSLTELSKRSGIVRPTLHKCLKDRTLYMTHDNHNKLLSVFEVSNVFLNRIYNLENTQRGELFQNYLSSKESAQSLANLFGRGIYALREEARIKRLTLAKHIGVEEKNIRNIEDGKYKRSVETCLRLIGYFKVPLIDIIELGRVNLPFSIDGNNKEMNNHQKHIIQILKDNNYNVKKASEILNCSTQYIYQFADSFNLDLKTFRVNVDAQKIYKTYLKNRNDVSKTIEELEISRSKFDKAKKELFSHEKNLRKTPGSVFKTKQETLEAIQNANYDYKLAADQLGIKYKSLRARAIRLLSKAERLPPDKYLNCTEKIN